MMLHILRRELVPACLTLGTLLFALPASADTPPAPAVVSSAAQMIVLQHGVPADVMKRLHWELPSHLPMGVTQIVAVPLQNSLLVTATPSGLAQVRQLVKIVDVEPREVQVKVVLAHEADADREVSGIGLNLYADGAPAVQLLETLTKRGDVTQQFVVTTASGVKAAAHIQAGPVSYSAVSVTPLVRANNSVTLTLSVEDKSGSTSHEMSQFRTLKSGNTMVFVMPPAVPGGDSFLCFVTPTLK